ncbi:MAG TPA: GAF domain-containing protein [Methylibium sp.]|uniref:GAF domain-containing protein n=1 Tax=Methylibium sp. TaxID=2067992 RepID=UPI002DB6C8E9|nr:GAF domain-containing protein [Methylibium sp.]HEU4458254.1 GAF domain-containing protein [Methylibium sp.]
MNKVLAVLFTVLLAVGWQWIMIGNRRSSITDEQMIWLGAALTIALLLQQIYQVISDPSAPERARKAQGIAENYLAALLAQYYEYVQQLDPAQQPSVRVNVMLLTRWFKLRSFLRMHYAATLPVLAYNNEERIVEWKKGEGVCGWAWQHRMTGLYDAERSGFDTAAKRRNPVQRAATQGLKSALSEPIWFESRIVGVLNLDSDAGLDQSRFDHATVRQLARTYADNLAAVCFPDGVRHK